MKAVWKYPLPGSDTFDIKMPRGAKILTAAAQFEDVCLWALVNPEAPPETRSFRLAGTGHEITENLGRHISTFQLANGRIVLHLFEVEP